MARRLRNVASIPFALRFLAAKVRELQPDLIYTSQQTYDLFYASLISRIFGLPHIIHVHYNVGPWLGRFSFRTIRQSSRLIAVSEFVRQTALLQGIAPEKISTIPNAIALPPISQTQVEESRQRCRHEFGLANDTPLVVAVGRLDPMKGHDALLNAFAQAVRTVPQAVLLICGRSSVAAPFESELRQMVVDLHLENHVIFAGWRADIPDIMLSADAFCLPSELEPFGLVFLEAMAAELPVIAYQSGGVPEIVIHERTGLLSYPGDIDALAANLSRVLSDREYAQLLGAAGRRRAASSFSANHIAGLWLKTVREKAQVNPT